VKTCFFHIEKTAGTSIYDVILFNTPNCVVFYPWYFKTNEHTLSPEKLHRFLDRVDPKREKGIGGHPLRPNDQIMKDYFTFTFLRDPIKRYLSYYLFITQHLKIKISLEQYLNDPYFHNFMTGRMSATKDIDEALKRLNQMSFVGLTERYAESMQALKSLNPGFIDRLFLSNSREAKNDYLEFYSALSSKDQDKVLRNNQLDSQLYQRGKELNTHSLKDIGSANSSFESISDQELNERLLISKKYRRSHYLLHDFRISFSTKLFTGNRAFLTQVQHKSQS
jgi:hypothetical protein